MQALVTQEGGRGADMAREGATTVAPNGKGRASGIDGTMAVVEREFGAGALRELGSAPLEAAEVISTGALSLDLALGIGGMPRGRIAELYGPESSGKTTLAYHVIAEAQAAGGR